MELNYDVLRLIQRTGDILSHDILNSEVFKIHEDSNEDLVILTNNKEKTGLISCNLVFFSAGLNMGLDRVDELFSWSESELLYSSETERLLRIIFKSEITVNYYGSKRTDFLFKLNNQDVLRKKNYSGISFSRMTSNNRFGEILG